MRPLKLIRGVITDVSAAAFEEAKLFSASGRPGETFKNREYFQHYGFTSRPLSGAEGLIISQGNTIYMIASDDRRYRISLEDGEVALYTNEGDKIHLKQGEILIKSGGKVVVDAPEVEVNAATSAKVVSPVVNLGAASGHKALATEDLLPKYTGHTHSGVQTGSGNTGVPNQPATTEKTVNLKAT